MTLRTSALLFLSLVAIALPRTSIAHAANFTYDVVVEAGAHDRENTPASVIVSAPRFLEGVTTVTLTDEQGQTLVGQVTVADLLAPDRTPEQRTLNFIVPRMKAGSKMAYKLTVDPPTTTRPASEQFQWFKQADEYAELFFGDRPVLRYMCLPYDNSTPELREDTYKVFHHLYAPNQSRYVTKGPGGKYPHHRGLYYGFNKITYGDNLTCDTWHCHEGAYEGHEKFLSESAGPVLGRHTVEIGWHGATGDRFAVEDRQLTAYHVPGGQLIDFESQLRSTDGKIRLDGDPQHAGFHFRANNAVAEKSSDQTYFLRPDGKGEMGAERNWSAKKPLAEATNLPWNAMSFVIDDKRYTAVYLDSPKNPKEARYSERTYGRFGSYFEYDFEPGQTLDLRYRVWLQEGEIDAAQADALSADFVDPVKVTINEVE